MIKNSEISIAWLRRNTQVHSSAVLSPSWLRCQVWHCNRSCQATKCAHPSGLRPQPELRFGTSLFDVGTIQTCSNSFVGSHRDLWKWTWCDSIPSSDDQKIQGHFQSWPSEVLEMRKSVRLISLAPSCAELHFQRFKEEVRQGTWCWNVLNSLLNSLLNGLYKCVEGAFYWIDSIDGRPRPSIELGEFPIWGAEEGRKLVREVLWNSKLLSLSEEVWTTVAGGGIQLVLLHIVFR